MQAESTRKRSPNEINDISGLLKEASRAIQAEILINQCIELPESSLSIPLGGELEHYANEYYERALQILSNQGEQDLGREYEVRLRFAAYFGFKRQHEKALPHVARCIELKPQDTISRVLLARLYKEMDRYQDSAREFYAAAKLSGFKSPWQTAKYLGSGLRQQLSR